MNIVDKFFKPSDDNSDRNDPVQKAAEDRTNQEGEQQAAAPPPPPAMGDLKPTDNIVSTAANQLQKDRDEQVSAVMDLMKAENPGKGIDDVYSNLPTHSPDEAAKTLKLAKQLNADPNTVADDPKGAEVEANRPDTETLNKIATQYPVTKKALENQAIHSVAHDDIEHLMGHEDMIQAMSDMWKAAQAGDEMVRLSKQQRQSNDPKLAADRIAQLRAEQASLNEKVSHAGFMAKKIIGIPEQLLLSMAIEPAKAALQGGLNASQTFGGTPGDHTNLPLAALGAGKGFYEYWKDQGAETMYQDTMATHPNADRAKVGEWADIAGHASAIFNILALGAGAAKLPVGWAIGTALKDMAARVPVAGPLFKTIASQPKLFEKLTLGKALTQAAKIEATSVGAVTSFGVVNAGINETAVHAATGDPFRWNQITSAIPGGIEAGLYFGTLGGAAHLYNTEVMARNAEMSKQFVTALAEHVQGSKLAARAPDIHADVAGEMHKNTPLYQLYVPVEEINKMAEKKGVDPVEAMSGMGLGDKYAQALETAKNGDHGARVAIPMDKVYEHYTPEMASLAENSTFDPNGSTVSEYRKEMVDQQNKLAKDHERVLTEANTAVAQSPELAKAHEEIAKDFAGWQISKKPMFMTDKDNLPIIIKDEDWSKHVNDLGKLAASYAVTEAPKRGVTPHVWFQSIKDRYDRFGDLRLPTDADFRDRPNGLPKNMLHQPGDILGHNALAVTAEAIPSTKLSNAINYSDLDVQERFTDKSLDLVHDIDKALGFPVHIERGYGGYAGGIHPNIIAEVMPSGDTATDLARVRSLARSMQYVFKQDAVPWFKADATQTHNGVMYTFDKALTPETREKFFGKLRETLGESAGFTQPSDSEIAVIDFDGKDTPGFLNKLDDLGVNHGKGFGVTKAEHFGSLNEYGPEQDWGADPSGKAVLSDVKAAPGESSNLQPWLSDRSEAFQKLLRDYTAYGKAALGDAADRDLYERRADEPPTAELRPDESNQAHPFFQPGPDVKYKPMDGLAPDMQDAEAALWKRLSSKDSDKWYAADPDTIGNRIGSVDILRGLSPEYVKNPLRYLLATQNPAASWVNNWYNEKVASPVHGPVMMMAGGGGSGKSTVLKGQHGGDIASFDAILDTVASNPVKTAARMDKALASGREVVYMYVHNPVLDAAKLAVKRFEKEGRAVPADILTSDHVRAQETLFSMRDRYAKNPNVHFKIIRNHIGGDIGEITFKELDAERYVKPGQNADEVIQNLYPQVKGVMKDVEAKLDEALGKSPEGASVADRIKSALGIAKEPSGVGILFQRGTESGAIPELVRGAIPRAYFEPTRYALRMLEHANTSSLFHEFAHLILQDKFDYVNSGKATAEYIKDWRPLADALGIDGKLTGAQHERFASWFERYMADGVAPRSELRGVFARSRVAMMRIYQHANNIGAPISDENRRVLDRLFATESQIDDASLTLHREPMPFANTEAYDASVKGADLTAKEELHRRLATPTEAEEPSKEVINSVGDTVDSLPVYKALKALSAKGGLKLGLDFIPEEMRDSFPAGTTASDGVHPDAIANVFGYENGDDMMAALANAEPRDKVVRDLIGKRMDELHGNIADDYEAQQVAALDALHNNDSLDMLKHEHRALVDKHPTDRQALKAILSSRRPDEEAKANAELAVRYRLVDDLRPLDFVRSERVSRREAFDAWSEGKFDDAIEAKQREMFAHELYRKTRDARDDVRASLKRFNVLTKQDKNLARTNDIDFINQARLVASGFGINYDKESDPQVHLQNLAGIGRQLDALRTSDNLADQVKYRSIKQTIEMASGHDGDFRQKPYGEFQIMRDTVDSLIQQAKAAKNFALGDKKIGHDAAVEELLSAFAKQPQRAPIGQHGTPTAGELRAVSTISARDHLRRLESWTKQMSGGDPEGAPTRLISWRLHDATDQHRVALAGALKKYNALFDKFKKDVKMERGAKIPAPEIGFTFGNNRDLPAHMELATAIMHTGNGFDPGSNGYKLLVGRNWGQLNDRGEVNTGPWYSMVRRLEQEGVVTKAHYDFAQGVQNLFDEFKPKLWEVYKDQFGFNPKEVTKIGYDTPFGHYAGGYAPAFVDRILDREMQKRDLWEEQSREAHVFAVPHVSYPMAKERVKYYAHPLTLDLGSMETHFNQLLRTIYIAPAVKEVSRLVSDPRVRSAITSIDPAAMDAMIIPALDRTLQQRVSSVSRFPAFDPIARAIRQHVSSNFIAYNPLAATNVLHSFPWAAQSTGWGNIIRSAAHYFYAPNDLTKEAMDKSAFMQTRVFNPLFEEREKIRKYLNNPVKEGAEYIEHNSRFMARGAAHAMDVITWHSAYDKAMGDGKSHDTAVHFADQTVRLTVGSHSPEDISSFEAGGQFTKLFTSMYSWRDVWLNNILTEGNLARRGDMLKKFGFLANMIALPILLDGSIKYASHGSYDSNDDGKIVDDWARSVGRTAFVSGAGFVPFGSNFAIGTLGMLRNGEADVKLAPGALGLFEHAAGGAYKLPHAYRSFRDNETLSGKDIVDISSLFGALLDLPLEGVARPLGYRHDVNSGKVHPKNKLDYLRGMATGQAPKK